MLEKLKDKIEKNVMFDADYLQSIDIDEVLDQRDDCSFDDEWVKTYEELQKVSFTEPVNDIINAIRETVFKKIYKITESSDLAAYISDDFELICKASVSGYENVWIAKLTNVYVNKEIPYGNLENNVTWFSNEFDQLVK